MSATEIARRAHDGQDPYAGNGVRVVCIGETMVMFAPPPYQLIESCNEFHAFLGGAESNVAIGLERLGVHAGWIGKLPDNALGRKLVNEMRGLGVDTSAVVWTPTGRVGTFFVEWGAAPRPVKTIYDRANSVASTLASEDLDWDYITRADWVVLTGITPALSAVCRETTMAVAQRARQAGRKLLLDLNYRALLWSREDARAAYEQLLPFVNLLVATEEDMQLLAEGQCDRKEALRQIVQRHSIDVAVMTLGQGGGLAFDGLAHYAVPGYAVQAVNRLGAGDAFVAGLLYGYMNADLQTGLRYASAMAALKLTIPQNIPLINRQDVERLLAEGGIGMVR